MDSTTSWLEAHRRPIRRSLVASAALGELAGLLLLLQTALLVEIGNQVMFEHSGVLALRSCFGALIIVIASRTLLAWAVRRASYACASAVKQTVRTELASRMFRTGPVALAGMRAGEIAGSFVEGVEALEGYFAKYLPQRAIATLMPFTVLAVVFPLDWISGLILVVTALFLPITMIVIGEEAHARNRRLWAKLARMSGRFLDSLGGLTTLRMFGAARREALAIECESEEYRSATMSVMRIAFLSSFMLELISTVSIAIVAVVSGFRMLAGTMQFAPGYFILLAAPEYFLTLRMLGTFYHSRMSAVSSAEQLVGFFGDASNRAAAGGESRGCSGGIGALALSLERVSISFGERRVLDDACLKIDAGEHVAVAGPSGAGKSTLLALLLGFVESTEGGLQIGFGNGPARAVKLSDWDALRERISWLPQRPTLFGGTIRANIALGRRDATNREVEQAARAAFADEFIERLPLGYDTRVGEGGQGLSGGQQQRIALARLFLRKADLLLLDEPTAHLDPHSSTLVREAIERLSGASTMLLVTHRVEEIGAGCRIDRIVRLAYGRIVATGAPP